jgi:hypothetical protein
MVTNGIVKLIGKIAVGVVVTGVSAMTAYESARDLSANVAEANALITAKYENAVKKADASKQQKKASKKTK